MYPVYFLRCEKLLEDFLIDRGLMVLCCWLLLITGSKRQSLDKGRPSDLFSSTMVVSPHERLSDEALRTVLSTVYALNRAKVDVDGYNLSNEFHTLCSNVIGIITSTLGEKNQELTGVAWCLDRIRSRGQSLSYQLVAVWISNAIRRVVSKPNNQGY